MIVGCIIPTLRNRPQFLNFCLHRMLKQTKKPDIIALIDYENTDGKVDISQRYKVGIKYLIKRGVDLILFIEDDDYYPLTYVEETCEKWEKSGKPNIFGCKDTVYYHLPTRQYMTTAPNHSSAYCTAVSPSVDYNVCGDNEAYYDVKLWRRNRGKQVKYKNKPIGIKHGIGKCGGGGHNPKAGWYKLQDPNLNYLKSVVDSKAFEFYCDMFYKEGAKYELVNVITRTHNRAEMFRNCAASVVSQTYKNIRHIIGSDTKAEYLKRYVKLEPKEVIQPRPAMTYPAPYNLYLNELAKEVKEGWVMYLDDDDKFSTDLAVETIVANIDNENQLLLWRVNINGRPVPCDKNFGKIVCGDISGIGFMFHSKHLPVDWGSWSLGDFRVITELSKKLEIKWIDKILTQTQGKPNRGK